MSAAAVLNLRFPLSFTVSSHHSVKSCALAASLKTASIGMISNQPTPSPQRKEKKEPLVLGDSDRYVE